MIDSHPLLGLLLPWLCVGELCNLRALNRAANDIVHHQTWSLHGEKLNHPNGLPHLVKRFTRVRQIHLKSVALRDDLLLASMVQLTNLQLVEVDLHQIWNLTDDHVRILTTNLTALEQLRITQCFHVKEPCIVGPNVRSVALDHCLVRQIHEDTRWPQLQTLTIRSRVLDTDKVRLLLKDRLRESRIEVLSLADCPMIQQVLLDPTELPHLRVLSLASCSNLERVHICSESLTSLDLSLCVALRHLLLVLTTQAVRLDLSLLQRLEHLHLECATLQSLDLDGCAALTKQHARVRCNAVETVRLHGTKLTKDELFSDDQDQQDNDVPHSVAM